MTPDIRRFLASHFGGMPATFWWLWTGLFICALATFVFPFLALFLTARGFAPAHAGLLASLFGAGIVVAGPVAGISCDRLGRRPTILSALLGSAACAGVLAFLSSPLAIGAVVLLFGVSSSAVQTPINATVADVVAPDHRPRAFGLLYWANNIGVGVSLLVGGLLASRSWALPFVADATTTLVFALLVWHRLPETRPAQPVRTSAEPTGPGYRAVLGDRRFAAFLALQVLFGAAFWQMLTSLPIHMVRHGFSATTFGRVLAVNTGLIMLLQPFAGRLTSRWPHTAVLSIASILVGVGFGAYLLCSTAWHYAVATGVWTLGEISYVPVAAALVAELAPPDLRGRYAGAWGLAVGVAGFVAPAVGPSVMQAFGSPVLWAGCLAAGLAVAAGYVALGRTLTSSRAALPRGVG